MVKGSRSCAKSCASVPGCAKNQVVAWKHDGMCVYQFFQEGSFWPQKLELAFFAPAVTENDHVDNSKPCQSNWRAALMCHGQIVTSGHKAIALYRSTVPHNLPNPSFGWPWQEVHRGVFGINNLTNIADLSRAKPVAN